jgi:hypothetical protein
MACQCAIVGDCGVGFRSLTTRRPQAGQNVGMRAMEKRA